MSKLGQTLTIVHGVTSKDLTKINGPTNYGSEYLLRETLHEYRVKVRHSTTKDKLDGNIYDRHNFEIVQRIFATDTVPEYRRKWYFVQEVLPSDDDVTLGDAIADLVIADTNELLDELNDWQS